MTIRIEVKSPLVTEINGISKAGKPYSMRKQTAWAYTMDQQGQLQPFPERIEFNIAEGQEGFPVGNYSIDPKSFFVGDFNSLAIGRLMLLPITSRASA